MKFRPIQQLTAATLLFATTAVPLLAGEKPAPPPLQTTIANWLSAFDGRVVFDIERRVRFEVRNNNRDFDDSINDDNDDSWLLTRFRLGVTVKPAPWLKLNAQGQDSRESDSGRPNVPGVRNFAGHEIDFTAKWTPAEWLKIEAGYSHFFAGDYLKDTGPRDDADFGYVMSSVKF